MIRVKICGITRLQDAQTAIRYGASALGFNFYPKSSRYISPENALHIIRQLPPFVSVVGLFVNEKEQVVREIVDLCGLETVQFHGDESPEFCNHFGMCRVIKVFRVKGRDDLDQCADYTVSGYLLDSFDPAQYGGTGFAFSWGILKSLDQSLWKDRALIIAGGINESNVDLLLQQIVPYGIDVCSGVEQSPGIKDLELVKKLMLKIKLFENKDILK